MNELTSILGIAAAVRIGAVGILWECPSGLDQDRFALRSQELRLAKIES